MMKISRIFSFLFLIFGIFFIQAMDAASTRVYGTKSGTNWGKIPVTVNGVLGVTYDPSVKKWFACGKAGLIFRSKSDDFKGWTETKDKAHIYNAIASNGKGVIVAVGNWGRYRYSTDGGYHWVTKSFLKKGKTRHRFLLGHKNNKYVVYKHTTRNFNGIAYDPKLKMWIAVGNSGSIQNSRDGKSWHPGNIGDNKNFNAVASNGQGMFIAVGNRNLIRISTDGYHWAPIKNATTRKDFYSVTYSPALKRWFFGTKNGSIYSYKDGETFVLTSIGDKPIYAITSNKSGILYAGLKNKIIRSTNGGVHWTHVGESGFNIKSIACIPHTNHCIAVSK